MDARDAVAAVWRAEAHVVLAVLMRVTRDLDRAEELAHDALVAALETWPRTGIPDRPGAWLVTTARNRALNAVRHTRMADDKHAVLAHEPVSPADPSASIDDDIGDEALRLVFTACHPALTPDARVALTLRLVGGLDTAEIARAFLVTEPTLAQRIVRAKKTIASAGLPYEVPHGPERDARLASVLDVVYLVFNEGYAASSGAAVTRPALVAEALRLGRILATLAPSEPEVLGLLALMLLHASREAARTDAAGDPVLLDDQDRARWDHAAIADGLATLARADALGRPPGAFHLQAAIAACHARAVTPADTDWERIAELYAALGALRPTPVIALNHAMAVSRARGPAAGLALIDAIIAPELARYPQLPAARADLLVRLGRLDEARAAFEAAAALTDNTRLRERLLRRARGV